MEIFSNHIKLFITTFLLFTGLSIVVAILPALNNQNNNAPLPGSEILTGEALAGKHVFISNGCVACHSQQVRNVDMDKRWASRPNVAADYAINTRMNWWMNTATLMGTERTGPDLTDIGNRLPNEDWQLLHLYNPRAAVEESIMPGYAWMFEWKIEVSDEDRIVNVPDEFATGKNGKLVASNEVLQLVAYLMSLKQVPLPDGTSSPEFLYEREAAQAEVVEEVTPSEKSVELDGKLLYTSNCQPCHQANGEGLKGAFPSLKESAIVLNDNPEILIDIIMSGYNAREEYGEMPAVGTNNQLTAAEVTAIINHERTSWGNHAGQIPLTKVEEIITFLKTNNTNQ